MKNLETVEPSVTIPSIDPLRAKQREDVAKMRTSLLMCSDDSATALKCIKDITVLRVYHQLARIIRYTEMMDKLEDKLYEAMDEAIDKMDASLPTTWIMLLNMQERLQTNMINSHKLLQPYLNLEEFGIDAITAIDADVVDPTALTLDRDSRDRLRTNAQKVLELISNNNAEVL